MRILTNSVLAVGLLLTVASCGSDKKSSDTTTASADTATGDTTTDETMTDETMTDETAGGVTLTVDPAGLPADLSAAQAAAVTKTVTAAAALGVTIDPVCLSAVVAKMSDADAQLIADAEVGEDPALSPEGAALEGEAQACATGVAGATDTTTG